MADQKLRSILFNRIVKAFRLRLNMRISRPFKCSLAFLPRYGIVNCFRKLVTVSQIWSLL